MRMQGKLSQASLAFLWDHQVSGRALFPAAAMLEAGSAAVCAALGTSSQTHSASLTSSAIPAALQLPPSASQPPEIAAVLDPGNASLSIESTSSSRSRTVHLKCSVSFMVDSTPSAALIRVHNGAQGSTISLGFAATRQMPTAFGKVAQRKALQAQEFLADPAIIDNGTQVGPAQKTMPAYVCDLRSCTSCTVSNISGSHHVLSKELHSVSLKSLLLCVFNRA